MKQINVWFEDRAHAFIGEIKEKHGGNWHDFLIDMARYYKTKGEPSPDKDQGEASQSKSEDIVWAE